MVKEKSSVVKEYEGGEGKIEPSEAKIEDDEGKIMDGEVEGGDGIRGWKTDRRTQIDRQQCMQWKSRPMTNPLE